MFHPLAWARRFLQYSSGPPAHLRPKNVCIVAPASAALGAPLQQYPNPLLFGESQADAVARLAGDLAPCVYYDSSPWAKLFSIPSFPTTPCELHP